MKKKVLTVLVITVVASMLFGSGFYAGAATNKGAGSQNDPVVSLSYLEYRLEQLEQSIGSGKGTVNAGNNGTDGQASKSSIAGGAARKVIIERGERLIPGEGSIIIVYSGACTAVGNLIDTSASKPLTESTTIPAYSQILIPTDESGVVASESTVLFVFG